MLMTAVFVALSVWCILIFLAVASTEVETASVGFVAFVMILSFIGAGLFAGLAVWALQ